MTTVLAPATEQPPYPFEGDITDRRSRFRSITRTTPKEPDATRAFVAAKLATLRSHKNLARSAAEESLAAALGYPAVEALAAESAPTPGGVGYGMFYTAAFRTAFNRGTSLYYEIVCPTQPAGNVNTYLYLTSTNRAQKGVEAFVSYNGQNDTRFKVFDWARTDHWQTDVRFADIGPYLHSAVAHGWGLQTIQVWNSTYEIGAGRWRNEVLLHNRAANRWDLVYRFDYNSNPAEQIAGWVGSWGPIVETFQSSYSGLRWLGFLNTMLIARDSAGNWGNWGLLGSSQSTVRNDGQGFTPLFLDPNYSLVVKS
ncbi:hypothetical protein OG921_19285 [Aldersonia sp. NBC_00410]|uniref:hypothetical protein n=1 Tax=Aldersonia sp. NBC_00410 TaxID=2975954 RepID=UPI00224FBC0A|nr:hypothetical protein [Aldersonia sp. NBC_00410]MCX5045313.1 hypothetical protein [Aldersonia sp. NBC_00410]